MPRNMAEFLDLTCERFSTREAIVSGDRRITYEELGRTVNRLANGFRSLGIPAGARVGVLLPNSAEWMMVDLALMRAGIAHVRLHTRLAPGDFEFLVNDASCTAVISTRELGGPLMENPDAYPTVEHWIVLGDAAGLPVPTVDLHSLEERGGDLPNDGLAVGPETYANIRYTAGTTGRPKGATFTHAGRLAGIGRFLAESAYLQNSGGPGLASPKRCLSIAPLTHAAATHLYWTFASGGTNHIPERASWDPEWTARYMVDEAITHLFLVPTMIYDLFQAAGGLATRATMPLETIVYGASIMPPDLLAESRERFGDVMVQLFGLTEADGAFAILHKADHLVAPQSVGRPFALTSFEVRDPDGNPLPAGEEGEIVGWGPMMMVGYLNRPDATAAALHDGWIRTGDRGYIDERGYLYYRGRMDDMIISGGLNVYPAEVELAISALPGVAECAVVWRPHERWGQEVVAVIVPGEGFDAEVLHQGVRSALAGYRRPKAYFLADALPHNQVGKLQRHLVRQSLGSLRELP